jgi:hypothetical protein
MLVFLYHLRQPTPAVHTPTLGTKHVGTSACVTHMFSIKDGACCSK